MRFNSRSSASNEAFCSKVRVSAGQPSASSFVTDADGVAVVIEAMRTYFFQRAAAVYFAVAGQIEMIADVTEAAVVDVVAAAILKAQGHALRRG